MKSPKWLKRKNSYVVYVFRRVPNSRYTKFGLNRLRGKRDNCFSFRFLVAIADSNCYVPIIRVIPYAKIPGVERNRVINYGII
jgi:hypothetical protein